MSKGQILGVVALLGAVILPFNYNIIINSEQAAAYNIFSDEALDEAISRAETVRDLAKANPSEVYPGIVEYLDALISDAKMHEYENTDEVIAALDEAVEAVPYLLGLNMKPVVRSQVEPKTVEQSRANAEAKATVGAVPKAEAVQAVTQVEVKVESDKEEKTTDKVEKNEKIEKVEKTVDQKETEVQSEVAELPKTGAVEDGKLGLASLLLAGAAVVVSTIAAAVAVVYAKKRQ